MDNPIGELTIEGHSYRIFHLASDTFHEDSHSDNIVGELTINKNRYLVAHTEGYSNDVSVEKEKKPVDILTRRELQIVMLVADGRVNKQIADQLNISIWTVSTHLRRIFAKLGVDSRAAMVYQYLNHHDMKEKLTA